MKKTWGNREFQYITKSVRKKESYHLGDLGWIVLFLVGVSALVYLFVK